MLLYIIRSCFYFTQGVFASSFDIRTIHILMGFFAMFHWNNVKRLYPVKEYLLPNSSLDGIIENTFMRGVNGAAVWLGHKGFFCLIGFIGFRWLV